MMYVQVRICVIALIMSCLMIAHAYRPSLMPSLTMKSGGHGQGFKFLPIVRGSPDEHFPRIIPVAGVYPTLSIEEFLAPTPQPAADVGTWNYDFSVADGTQLGTVALPGSLAITSCIDPVVLIATNTALGVSAVEEVEMLVVVDRAVTTFSKESFFLFRTDNDQLTIKWCDSIEGNDTIMGKIAMCAMPWHPSMVPKKTGFLEDDGEE